MILIYLIMLHFNFLVLLMLLVYSSHSHLSKAMSLSVSAEWKCAHIISPLLMPSLCNSGYTLCRYDFVTHLYKDCSLPE